MLAFRVMEIIVKELSASLDSTEEGLENSCKEAFGIDEVTGGSPRQRVFARVHKAWSRALVDAEVKLRVDGVSRAHGERVTPI